MVIMDEKIFLWFDSNGDCNDSLCCNSRYNNSSNFWGQMKNVQARVFEVSSRSGPEVEVLPDVRGEGE